MSNEIRCPACNALNDAGDQRCFRCRSDLSLPAAPSPPGRRAGGRDPLETLIPYRNSRALAAYYLGVFSLIPVFGIPLGIAAFFLGLQGLRFANANSEAGGRAHALVGIIAGALFGFGGLIGVLAILAHALAH